MHFAIIGTGYWGENHLRVASELYVEGRIDAVTICDADEGRASRLSDAYGFEYTVDYADLVDRGVDAATVATPSNTHHRIATELLDAGIDLLVEKPIALDSDDAWGIVETADRNDCTLAVGHIFRHHPALNGLKERVDRGELGELKNLMTNRFSFVVPRSTTGALYSLAVHDVDVYNYLLDELPERIYCRLDAHVREGIDETATLVLEYPGVTGTINVSWQVPVFGKRRDLTVVGSERSGHIDYLEDTVLELHESRVLDRGGTLEAVDEGTHRHESRDQEPLKLEVEDFLDATASDRRPKATGRVGAQTIELLEYAEKSNDNHEVVRVRDG